MQRMVEGETTARGKREDRRKGGSDAACNDFSTKKGGLPQGAHALPTVFRQQHGGPVALTERGLEWRKKKEEGCGDEGRSRLGKGSPRGREQRAHSLKDQPTRKLPCAPPGRLRQGRGGLQVIVRSTVSDFHYCL